MRYTRDVLEIAYLTYLQTDAFRPVVVSRNEKIRLKIRTRDANERTWEQERHHLLAWKERGNFNQVSSILAKLMWILVRHYRCNWETQVKSASVRAVIEWKETFIKMWEKKAEGKYNKKKERRERGREEMDGRNGAATTRVRLTFAAHAPQQTTHPRRRRTRRRAILRPAATTGVRPYVKAGVCSLSSLGSAQSTRYFARISLLCPVFSIAKLDRGRDLNFVDLLVAEQRIALYR